jgi:diguanylate cyclase (GGDEF)-like protein
MTAIVSEPTESIGSSGDARWYITATVAMFAIAVFAYSGSKIMPLVVSANPQRALESEELTGFLLNIALILFAWKRSAELKRASAERDAAVNRAHDLAYIDEVTGLFNRRYLRERIAELQAANARAALFLLDLDRFKRINDLYGHAVGDEVLIAVSRRIRNACPPGASCVRLGGDEFAVLFDGDDAREKQLGATAEKVVGVLRDPVSVTGTIAVIGASLGIAVRTKRCKDPGAMLKRADIAMYEAKRRGRNGFVFFDSTMEPTSSAATRWKPTSAAASARASSCPTSSRSSTWLRRRSSASRFWPAGTIPRRVRSSPASSSTLPKRPE